MAACGLDDGGRDAVRIPLRRAQIGIADDPLDQIVVESQRDPFYLQQ